MVHSYNKKSGIFISLIVLIMLVCPVIHAETKVSQILEKVVESHRQFAAGMTVPYQREILSRSMAMLEEDTGADRASGVFFFKEPNFLKVQQNAPRTEYVFSNGQTIWWYVPDEKTAYRFDDMGKELSILSMIFMGLKNPEDSFGITIVEPQNADELTLTLSPRESLEEIDSINVTVSSRDYRIKKIEIIDIAGNITRFKLGAFELKSDLDNSFFDFKIPDGVKVIEEE